MARFREGTIVSISGDEPSLLRATVDLGSATIEAVGYTEMVGPLHTGDRVVVNTTGIELKLGTGGTGFILWNLDGRPAEDPSPGHIMKLRYTPWQLNVLAAEAPESPHHEVLEQAIDLDGMPVIACGLHSQVPAAAAGAKASLPGAKIGYLMTDGGALPLVFSDLVRQMRRESMVDVTCTAGHAFGGDLEAVNVHSGLVALKQASGCDVVIVSLGPGIVGTGTALGHTGIEQGQVLDATTALRGYAVAALRISFGEERSRHRGLSHHTVSALTIAARERCTVAIPKLRPELSTTLSGTLKDSGICDRHDTRIADGRPGVRWLLERDMNPTSMGRKMSDAPELWLAGAAAGVVATERLQAGR
jgi:hypothetical protein